LCETRLKASKNPVEDYHWLRNYVVYRSNTADINYTKNFYNMSRCSINLLASNDSVERTLDIIKYEDLRIKL
jgi:hypothetical protein